MKNINNNIIVPEVNEIIKSFADVNSLKDGYGNLICYVCETKQILEGKKFDSAFKIEKLSFDLIKETNFKYSFPEFMLSKEIKIGYEKRWHETKKRWENFSKESIDSIYTLICENCATKPQSEKEKAYQQKLSDIFLEIDMEKIIKKISPLWNEELEKKVKSALGTKRNKSCVLEKNDFDKRFFNFILGDESQGSEEKYFYFLNKLYYEKNGDFRKAINEFVALKELLNIKKWKYEKIIKSECPDFRIINENGVPKENIFLVECANVYNKDLNRLLPWEALQLKRSFSKHNIGSPSNVVSDFVLDEKTINEHFSKKEGYLENDQKITFVFNLYGFYEQANIDRLKELSSKWENINFEEEVYLIEKSFLDF